MTHAQLELFSSQAVVACGVLYFLSFVAQLGVFVSRDRVAEPAAVGASAGGAVAVDTRPPAAEPAYDRKLLFQRLAFMLTLFAAAVHFSALVTRGLAADPVRVPWGNMYEFTLTATFVVVVLYLLMHRRFALDWMAPLISGFVVVVLMVDQLFLYEGVVPLRDALQSPWLVIHVVAAIIATGAFTMGGISSVLYLVKERALARGKGSTGYLGRVPSLANLDRLAYRWHAFAFPIWTFAALIAGPIWAQYAWGRYWGWDPKEVWAFITWVVYAGYLHARATAGWKGNRAAIVALVGLATLWFNFIGINFFFGSGSQHSYAAELVVRTLTG